MPDRALLKYCEIIPGESTCQGITHTLPHGKFVRRFYLKPAAQELALIRHYFEPATSEPYSCGQWDSALKATPHSPKGDVSYVGALKQTVRSDAHGFRSRRPRSLLTVLNFCRIRVN